MTLSSRGCVANARPYAPRISEIPGLHLDDERISGTAGQRFHTIADMMPVGWHDRKSTANAVGW